MSVPSAKMFFSAAAGTSSGRPIQWACVFCDVVPTLGPAKEVSALTAKNWFGTWGRVLYLQEVRSLAPHSLPSVKQREPSLCPLLSISLPLFGV